MAFKFVIISCLVAVVRAATIPAAALVPEPVAVAPVVPTARLEEYDPTSIYSFGYEVVNSITGDIKSQREERVGDVVRGQYTLVDPDNTLRIVTYTADDVHGFNAEVRKEALVAAPAAVVPEVVEPVVPARVAAPAVVQEPVFPARFAAPAAFQPAARLVSAPAPVFASAPAFAPRYSSFGAAPAPLARFSYQPFSPFAAPVAFPGAPAQVVTV